MAEGPQRTVISELMSSPVLTATPSETLGEVAARMHERHCGSIVVVEGDECVGILTERDLLRAMAAGASYDSLVSFWMTSHPQTLAPTATWNEASELLQSGGFRHIPICDGDALVGLVSQRDLMKVAYLLASEQQSADGPIDAPSGLENVAVARTAVGDVQGQRGFYHYRGYNAVDIAVRGSVEDAWHLMLEGELPRPEERDRFIAASIEARTVPAALAELLPGIARLGSPGSLDALRTAVSAAAQVLGVTTWIDQDEATTRRQALTLAALTPVLAAQLYRLRTGHGVVEPSDRLGYAANYLYMLTGREPDDDQVAAVERYLILTIDHGFNASTFSSRVISSTGADIGSALSGAIGALSGPLHGGAPARVLAMLEEIGTPDNAEAWIRSTIEGGGRLMGFGHRVYKTADPRAVALHDVARRFGGGTLEFAEKVEETAVRLLDRLKPGRKLYANVEYYAGVVLEQAGVPRDMFSPTFACSRTIGWTANVLEQTSDNRIFRPVAHYVGPPAPRELPDWWQPG